MFTPSLSARARSRRAHYLSAAGVFGALGFQAGVWAVQLAPLSLGLGLDPATLGIAVTVAAASGLVTLFVGGALADRAGCRPVLVIGFAGTATAFALLAKPTMAATASTARSIPSKLSTRTLPARHAATICTRRTQAQLRARSAKARL